LLEKSAASPRVKVKHGLSFSLAACAMLTEEKPAPTLTVIRAAAEE
jgi:hypothetical protein